MDGVALTRTETGLWPCFQTWWTKSALSLVPPLFFVNHRTHGANLPAALPFPIEDQRQGFKAIRPGSFVILSIGYEPLMKKLLDPDVDDVMT